LAVGRSYENALAEEINGHYKIELTVDGHDCLSMVGCRRPAASSRDGGGTKSTMQILKTMS
jgi:hypothetical protein